MFWLRTIALILFAVLTFDTSVAETLGERRLALVIGEGDYVSVPRLPNPPSDAEQVGAALRDVGFTKVTVAKNLSHLDLLRALRDFASESVGADWAVVYYAGHGIEVQGKNYMIPTDAELATDTDVDFEAVSMDAILASVARAGKLRLVILDACRDNPFMRTMRRTLASRSLARGLARMDTPGDLFVVYSAQAGATALDGADGESPFVKALLKNIRTPGLEIDLLFRRVRADVMRDTNAQQEPAFEGSLPGEELFFQRAPTPVVAAVAPPLARPADSGLAKSPVSLPAGPPQTAPPHMADVPKPTEAAGTGSDKARKPPAGATLADASAVSAPSPEQVTAPPPRQAAVAGAAKAPAASPEAAGRNIEIVKTEPTKPTIPKPVPPPVDNASKDMSARLEDGRPPKGVGAEADRRLMIVEVQAELRRLGCSAMPPDGSWSSEWKSAFAKAAKRLGVDVDDNDPSSSALSALRKENVEVCRAVAEHPPVKARPKIGERQRRRPVVASPQPAVVDHRAAVIRVPRRREAPPEHVVRERPLAVRPVADARPRAPRTPSNCFVFSGQRAC